MQQPRKYKKLETFSYTEGLLVNLQFCIIQICRQLKNAFIVSGVEMKRPSSKGFGSGTTRLLHVRTTRYSPSKQFIVYILM